MWPQNPVIYDVVMIGAGHNALAAAAILAAKGRRVAVFERNDDPGGCVRTSDLTLPGFHHDWGAMNLNLFAGSPFHRQYQAELDQHGLDFAPATDCFASVFPDGRWCGVSTDLETTAARFAAFNPDDALAWRRMVARFDDLAPHLFSLLGSPLTLPSLARTTWNCWRAGGHDRIGELARLCLSSIRDFLDTHFVSPEIKATLALWGMHLDFPPDQAGGALFPYLEAMICQKFGMVIGKGGAQTMITALCNMAAARGVDIHYNAEIVGIIRDGKRATGVQLADGRRVEAQSSVIAGVAPRALLQLLGEGGSGKVSYDNAMRRFRHAPGTMMIHMALDDLPDWQADPALRRFAYVGIAADLKTMNDAYSAARDGLLVEEPVLIIGQPTAIDPSRAPPGKHILWIQTRFAPARICGDVANTITTTDWSEAKEAYADRITACLERYAPGITAKIRHRTVFSPDDLEAGNPNLVGGDQLCGSHQLAQHFLFRPSWGYSNWTTPVARLYHIGAATWPGAGVGAASGTMLAQRISRRR